MTRQQIFGKSIIAVIFIIIAGGYLTFRGYKEKKDFLKKNCTISYIGQKDASGRESNGKYRYLEVDNYTGIFKIFIGQDPGDFSPTYENIDQLKAGDTITIYYDETSLQKSEYNNLLQYIDKGGNPFFIKGSSDKYLGYVIIGLGILIGILLTILKKKGKIE